jgi:MFS family permease
LTDITIVNVALPDIQRALHSSFADLQWVVGAYALTLASFLLTAGSLADIYGRRVLYLIGLVFTAASALCGFATSTLMLQLSRGLQGSAGRSCSRCRWRCWPTPSAARTAASRSGCGAR